MDFGDGREQFEDTGCSRITAFVLLGGSGRVKTSQTPAVNFVAAPYGCFYIYSCEVIAGNRRFRYLGLGLAVFRVCLFSCHAQIALQCVARHQTLIP